MGASSLSVLICRANRKWLGADRKVQPFQLVFQVLESAFKGIFIVAGTLGHFKDLLERLDGFDHLWSPLIQPALNDGLVSLTRFGIVEEGFDQDRRPAQIILEPVGQVFVNKGRGDHTVIEGYLIELIVKQAVEQDIGQKVL